MAHDYAARIARAREELQRLAFDALIVTPSADLVYLAGYDPPPLKRLTALVLRRDADPVLVVPELERLRAADSPAGKLVDIRTWPDGGEPYTLVASLIGSRGRVGVAERMWASHLIELQQVLGLATFELASTVLGGMRARKDREEIELLSRAARAADETFRRVSAERLEGRREYEVARSLSNHLVECGHDSVAFTIVGSGPNGASPHHEPGSRGIRKGDAIVLDFGGRIGGYCSDVTRTVSVGAPSPDIREVHEVVARAQQAAFEAVRPGVRAEDIDRVARTVIEEAGYGPYFVHRTGHGIGLEEHEPPWLVAGNDEPLEEGMAFSIEPGIYLDGKFGVRIEDIVVVTASGARRLNNVSRDLEVVA